MTQLTVTLYPTCKNKFSLRTPLGTSVTTAAFVVSNNQLTPRSSVLLQKLIFPYIVKKLKAFCGNLMFITAFTTARRLSLSSVTSFRLTSSNLLLEYTF